MTNQQLKAHCEDVIANPQDHLDWVVDMARVALASLDAEPFAYISENIDNCYQSFGYGYTKPIYTAPPAPELKPIELPPRHEPSFGAASDFSDGFNYCIEEVKRLNGVKS